MRSQFSDRFETFLGIGLLLVAVLGFILMIILNLPRADEVNQRAKLLKEIPEDLFSGSNPVNQQIQSLNVPNGVPVEVDPNNLGRSNVFENF